MIYTVNYTKAAGFMRQVSAPKLKTKGEDGMVTSKEWTRAASPRSKQTISPIFDRTKGWRVGLKQSELDALVKEMHVHDRDGNRVTEASLMTPSSPFWKTADCKLTLHGGTEQFDDETPRGKYLKSWFLADSRFEIEGKKVHKSKKEYSVVRVGGLNVDESEKQSVSKAMKATGIFDKMDMTKKVDILKVMGVNVNNADDDTVNTVLYNKITVHANERSRRGAPVNIDLFLSLHGKDESEFRFDYILSAARRNNIIVKTGKAGRNTAFKFGEMKLGEDFVGMEKYLKENDDVFKSIEKAVKLIEDKEAESKIPVKKKERVAKKVEAKAEADVKETGDEPENDKDE